MGNAYDALITAGFNIVDESAGTKKTIENGINQWLKKLSKNNEIGIQIDDKDVQDKLSLIDKVFAKKKFGKINFTQEMVDLRDAQNIDEMASALDRLYNKANAVNGMKSKFIEGLNLMPTSEQNKIINNFIARQKDIVGIKTVESRMKEVTSSKKYDTSIPDILKASKKGLGNNYEKSLDDKQLKIIEDLFGNAENTLKVKKEKDLQDVELYRKLLVAMDHLNTEQSKLDKNSPDYEKNNYSIQKNKKLVAEKANEIASGFKKKFSEAKGVAFDIKEFDYQMEVALSSLKDLFQKEVNALREKYEKEFENYFSKRIKRVQSKINENAGKISKNSGTEVSVGENDNDTIIDPKKQKNIEQIVERMKKYKEEAEGSLQRLLDVYNNDVLDDDQVMDVLGYYEEYEKQMKVLGKEMNQDFKDMYNDMVKYEEKIVSKYNEQKTIYTDYISKHPQNSDNIEQIKANIIELEKEITNLEHKKINFNTEEAEKELLSLRDSIEKAIEENSDTDKITNRFLEKAKEFKRIEGALPEEINNYIDDNLDSELKKEIDQTKTLIKLREELFRLKASVPSEGEHNDTNNIHNNKDNSEEKSYLNYLNNLNKAEQNLAKQNQRMAEHIAQFDKYGNLLSDNTGDFEKSKVGYIPNATTLLHSHPVNKEYNNLRFSDKDMETFMSAAINGAYRKNILYCGNQLLEMDITNVDPKNFQLLNQHLASSVMETMYVLGNTIFDEQGNISIKETNIQKLGSEFMQRYTELINSVQREILAEYGGTLKSYEIKNGTLAATDIFSSNPYDLQESRLFSREYNLGIRNQSAYKKVKEEFDELRNIYQELKNVFGDDLPTNALVSITEACKDGTLNLEELKENYDEVIASFAQKDIYGVIDKFQKNSDNKNSKYSASEDDKKEESEEVHKKIVVDNDEALEKIKEVEIKLNELPETKTVKIEVETDTERLESFKEKADESKNALLLSDSKQNLNPKEDLSVTDGVEKEIKDVEDAVRQKTQAFAEEGQTVQNTIALEIHELETLIDELNGVKTVIQETFNLNDSTKDAIGSLDELLSKTEQLKNFATILSATEEQLESAKKTVDDSEKAKVRVEENQRKAPQINNSQKDDSSKEKKEVVGSKGNNNSQIISEYKELIKLTKERQELQLKANIGIATDEEVQKLNSVTTAINNQIKALNERQTVLTSDEMKMQKEYLDVDKTAKGYSSNEFIQQTTKQLAELKNKGFEGIRPLVQSVEKEISELNEEFAKDGNITKYTDAVSKAFNKLDRVVATTTPYDKEKQKTEVASYLAQISGGKVTPEDIKWSKNEKGFSVKWFDDVEKRVKSFRGEIDNVNGAINRMASTSAPGLSKIGQMFESWKQRLFDVFRYLTTFVGVYEIWGAFKQGVNIVREFDTALTEMRKVSDESVKSLKGFQKESFGIADSVGTTSLQIQNSTADFLRLGCL